MGTGLRFSRCSERLHPTPCQPNLGWDWKLSFARPVTLGDGDSLRIDPVGRMEEDAPDWCGRGHVVDHHAWECTMGIERGVEALDEGDCAWFGRMNTGFPTRFSSQSGSS